MSAPPAPLRALAAHTPWLAALAVITLLSLGTYAGLQQTQRGAADEPQVALAEDASARLAGGADPRDVLPAVHVDAARSLTPWVAVARTGVGVLASNADLDGRAPLPPAGVLAFAERAGQHRVTWQPAPRVRIALVAMPVPGHDGLLVLSGRSLRETETRVNRLGRIVLLAWAASAGVLAAARVIALLLAR